MPESSCIFCETVKGKTKLQKIYEDETFVAVLHPTPAAKGHILVFTKKHYPIVEQIPDYELGDLFKKVNKLSVASFEGVKAAGSNIIIQNGVAAGQRTPHICVNIIPRVDNDGLNFLWQPKQLTEEEMSTIELKVKEETEKIGGFEKEQKREPVKIEEKREKIAEKEGDEEENYLIKQLGRIP